MIKIPEDTMLAFGDGPMETGIDLAMPCIQAAVADHLKVLLRDVTNEPFYEINGRDSFLYVFVIFMTIVMEGDRITVIVINSGSSNNGTAKITADIFDNCSRVTKHWFGINIEPLFMVAVTFGFDLFKRRPDDSFHFIQESSAESVAEIGVIKVMDMTPETIITETAFRDEAVNMRVPFEIPAEGM